MTTNKDLPKPEHGTIQAQDIHEIEKESEADSTEEQNSFHAGFITVQIIRLVLEAALLQSTLISSLSYNIRSSGFLGFLFILTLFSPFIIHIPLQIVACIKMIWGTKTAWILGTNAYGLLAVAPLAAFYTSFIIGVTASNVDVQPLRWILDACALEAIISIFTIIVVSIYNWKNKKLSSHNKNMDTDKRPTPDNTLSGFKNAIYETDDLKTLKKHREEPVVEVPWQQVSIRSQKKDWGEHHEYR